MCGGARFFKHYVNVLAYDSVFAAVNVFSKFMFCWVYWSFIFVCIYLLGISVLSLR